MSVVVVGARGFLGSAICHALGERGISVKPFSRLDGDLTDQRTIPYLRDALCAATCVVFCAAITPDRAKDADPITQNVTMFDTFCKALEYSPDIHVVYLSSDSVYALANDVYDEDSLTQPRDDYGRMHLEREQRLEREFPGRFTVLRLTQVYGPGDSHNAYGPCRFIRQALTDEPIALFGSGEDCRDHIWIGDVCLVIALVVARGPVGRMNVAAGHSPSFMDVAQLALAHFPAAQIFERERRMPCFKKRFRNARLRTLLEDTRLTDINKGIELLATAMRAESNPL
ncbi:MAG: NAD(P)-dependent oxidoreductase [Verrucomicrobia bacterium]|nr:NAD(P)-dependent oxidoreductase [Verrucomicrobiota bacterium]